MRSIGRLCEEGIMSFFGHRCWSVEEVGGRMGVAGMRCPELLRYSNLPPA